MEGSAGVVVEKEESAYPEKPRLGTLAVLIAVQ
jgi:hypothetical protein